MTSNRPGSQTVRFVTVAAFAASLLVAPAALGQSATQPLSSDAIIQQLKPKLNKPLTRGLKPSAPTPTLPEAERAYLGKLPTRGLKVEMKQQVAKIIDTYDLPHINIEIQFAYNSAEITPASLPDLNALGQALLDRNLGQSRMLLNGHTDAAGSRDYNMDLSERRADAVRGYLVSTFGISPDRLIAVGFGEERLKNPVQPEAAENRRVEIVNLDG